ncbi:MAG TPA: SAM-dependent methyltransferase [Steroidobacteraceae bacterium]
MTRAEAGSSPLALSADEQAHTDRVLQRVSDAIAAHDGWLPFDEYMNLVLYEPGLGYYSAGAIKIGAGGDFVTAPEISPLFGHCVARQCAEFLQGTAGELLELGAGTGRLAADVLTELARLGALPSRYSILEISAELRERQQRALASLPSALQSRVQWLDSLPAAPMSGLILANEVADALPVERFVVSGTGVAAEGVGRSATGALECSTRPAPAALQAEFARLEASLPAPLPSGYRSEICPRLDAFVHSLADCVREGAVLLFDYGLGRAERYHPQRDAGTLQCHFRHRAHGDPLLHPGLQDITAWVDFTRLAEAAARSGLHVAGYCTQAAFLLASGIESELAGITAQAERARRASEARQLLLPGELGETFKAMALTRAANQSPSGFTVQDLRRLL